MANSRAGRVKCSAGAGRINKIQGGSVGVLFTLTLSSLFDPLQLESNGCPGERRAPEQSGLYWIYLALAVKIERLMEHKRAYSLYDAMRRVLDPLRRDWDSFTQDERDIIIREMEGFLRSVKPPDDPS